MKKQHIIQSLMAFIFALGFTACADEDIVESNGLVVEGVPVKVQIPISIPKMEVMESRGLSEAQEKQTNDLYILVFDKDGNREAGFFFENNANTGNKWILSASTDNRPAIIETDGKDQGYGNLTLAITSGTKYIYGFANVADNALVHSYKTNLDGVQTIEELKNVQVSFYTTEVSALAGEEMFSPTGGTANIPMSGHFDYADGTNTTGECQITPNGTVTTDGKIYLHRLFAKIKFIIQGGQDENGNKVTFELKDWKAYHLPQRSMLIPDAAGNDADDYNATNAFLNTDIGFTDPTVEGVNVKEGKYGFQFYMLENRKAYKGNTGDLADYWKRETLATDGSGRVYQYVEDNATYIHLTGKLKMKVNDVQDLKDFQEGKPENQSTKYTVVDRIADVEYIIHLGGQEPGTDSTPDVDNFDVLRNTSYTYEITINGVKDIVTKVKQETEANDPIPGAEGEIVDVAGGKGVYELDCHNHVFNVSFTNKDKPFFFRVVTPETEGDFNNIKTVDSKKTIEEAGIGEKASLLTWIQFRPTEGKDVLALYKPEATDLMNLFELAEYVDEKMGNNEEKWFTVFVKEYYYDKKPSLENPTDDESDKDYDWGLTNWPSFVNKANRSVILDLYTIGTEDGKSNYSQGDLYITQKSIQTYYGSGELALGVEHKNETGIPLWNEYAGNDTQYMFRNKWYQAKYLNADETINEERTWENSVSGMNYDESKTYEENLNAHRYLTKDNGYYNQYMALIYYGQEGDPNDNNKGKLDGQLWSNYIQLTQPINYDFGLDDRFPTYGEAYFDGTPFTDYDKTVSNVWGDKEGIVDCLTRNRDENGDGILQAEEMKWYLPASDQMNDIYLGAGSLVSPLYPYEKFPNKDQGPNYHYLSSDIRTFWSNEGNSTGETHRIRLNNKNEKQEDEHINKQIRCVRNLGAAYPKTSIITDGSQAYFFNNNATKNSTKADRKIPQLHVYNEADKTFTFPHLATTNFRDIRRRLQAKDPANYNGSHTNFGEENKVYSGGFQMANKFVTAYSNDQGTEMPWDTERKDTDDKQVNVYYKRTTTNLDGTTTTSYILFYLGSKDPIDKDKQGWTPCDEYSQEPNEADKGTWRMPNQKELAIMGAENPEYVMKPNDVAGYSNTTWNYNTQRTFAFHEALSQNYLDGGGDPDVKKQIKLIRCVRDIGITAASAASLDE